MIQMAEDVTNINLDIYGQNQIMLMMKSINFEAKMLKSELLPKFESADEESVQNSFQANRVLR
jgi:hypothetical protein